MKSPRILLLSRYGRLGASSRVRSYQYLPYLEHHGISVTSRPFFDHAYLERKYAGGSVAWSSIARSYIRRCADLLKSGIFDALWLEYEVFPWLPFLIESSLMSDRVPYVVDYDDAIFHRYENHASATVRSFLGGKIRNVMKGAHTVIAANRYIASYAAASGARRIVQIPTVVDLDRYQPVKRVPVEPLVVGWIGTPMTAHYLTEILPALQQICDGKQARLLLVGAGPVSLADVHYDVVDWAERREVELLNSIDIGIMPLPDLLWERGKSGYKLVQYMACGKPVVASPVGCNVDIVRNGENGFLASTNEEWKTALNALIQDEPLRKEFGQCGRSIVEISYSLQACAPMILDTMTSAAWGDH